MEEKWGKKVKVDCRKRKHSPLTLLVGPPRVTFHEMDVPNRFIKQINKKILGLH